MSKLTRSFSFDTERDADLLAWLDAQANASQAVRDALRSAMSERAAVTLADVYEAVRALAEGGVTAHRARTDGGDAEGTAAAAVNLSQLGLGYRGVGGWTSNEGNGTA